VARAKLTNNQAALEILKTLRDRGHHAYFVGGCVRDMLLDRPPREHDIATDATPDQICQLFRKTRKVGAKFGVVLVGKGKYWVEVATFRQEGEYLDGRHPQQISFTDARQDAFRRDFTINGLFLDPLTGQITDYVEGRKDLQAGIIRAIGDPQRRFAEDYLRMLRAVRFAASLEFQIEPKTAQAIRQQAASINSISTERIRDELVKILAAPTRSRGIELANQLGLLEHVIPDLMQMPDKAFAETLAVLDHLPTESTTPLSTAALLHLVGLSVDEEPQCGIAVRAFPRSKNLTSAAKQANRICRNLTYSNGEREQAVWLVQYLPLICRNQAMQLSDIKRMIIYRRYEALNALYHARVQAGLEDSQLYEKFQQTSRNCTCRR